MTARTGEVTCIFGPNGCGKSTLLKAMVGVIDPWAGSVTIDATISPICRLIAPSAAGSR
jgi:ABC-type cobalamin/Fe3+-siderophores transport systems, ATPase components